MFTNHVHLSISIMFKNLHIRQSPNSQFYKFINLYIHKPTNSSISIMFTNQNNCELSISMFTIKHNCQSLCSPTNTIVSLYVHNPTQLSVSMSTIQHNCQSLCSQSNTIVSLYVHNPTQLSVSLLPTLLYIRRGLYKLIHPHSSDLTLYASIPLHSSFSIFLTAQPSTIILYLPTMTVHTFQNLGNLQCYSSDQ